MIYMNWKQDNSAVSDMWAFGQRSFEEISHELAARKAIESDIKDSKPYIDVMHQQIGDSYGPIRARGPGSHGAARHPQCKNQSSERAHR